MDHEDELADEQCAIIGRIVICVAAAESIVSKLWWHYAFRSGATLDLEKLHRQPMATKLQNLRALVPRDGSREDCQTQIIVDAFEEIEVDRHAIVHGFPATSAEGPLVLNLRQNHHVWVEDLPAICMWARHLRNAAFQMYVDAHRGIYADEAGMPPLRPLLTAPPPLQRKQHLIVS